MIDPLDVARRTSAELDVPTWLVGGRLRDSLLGRFTLDTDVVIAGDAWGFAIAAANRSGGSFVGLHRAPDVARVVWTTGAELTCLDVAGLEGADLEADLRRRDYTVNAMAVAIGTPLPPLSAAVADPTGGLGDLTARTIRMTHGAVFDDDPLRLLRGPRLAAELGFQLDVGTAARIRDRAPLLTRAAAERIRDELLRLLGTAAPAAAVSLLERLGLLAQVLPEVVALQGVRQPAPHRLDVYRHSLAVVAALSDIEEFVACGTGTLARSAWATALEPFARELSVWLNQPAGDVPRRTVLLRLAGLLHDVGKPACASASSSGRSRFVGHDARGAEMVAEVANRLRLSCSARHYLATLVELHTQPRRLAITGGVSRRAIYRFYDRAGHVGVDVALHAVADAVGKGREDKELTSAVVGVVGRLLAAWFDQHAELVAPPPLIRGDELGRALGIALGPQIGRLLRAIREAQAAGEVASAAQALALARSMLRADEE